MNVLRVLLAAFILQIGLNVSPAAFASPNSIEQAQIALAVATPAATQTPKAAKTPGVDATENDRVAEAIAKYFGVAVSQINAWHDSGKGWGGIMKVYALAKASGKSVDDIFAMRADEQGWGVIVKTLAVGKWDTNLGAIMRNASAEKNFGDDAPGNSGAHRNVDKNKDKPDDKGKLDGKGKNK